jgi:hypothetical protein
MACRTGLKAQGKKVIILITGFTRKETAITWSGLSFIPCDGGLFFIFLTAAAAAAA